MTLDHQLIWLEQGQSVNLRAYGLSVLSVNVAATDAPLTLKLQTRNGTAEAWADVPHTAITLLDTGSAQAHFNADSLGKHVQLVGELDSEDEEHEFTLAGAVLATRQR